MRSFLGLVWGKVESNRNDFAGIYFNPNEHCVVLHEVALLQHFVRHEPRKAEAERVGFLARTLEILPRRVWDKTFNNVARLFWARRLIEQRERHGMRKRPPQQSVVLSWQDFDVHRNVGIFPGTVTIWK